MRAVRYLALLCSVVILDAHANVIEYSADISTDLYGINLRYDFAGDGAFSENFTVGLDFLELPRFDSSLGTLQNVLLNLHTTVGSPFLYVNAIPDGSNGAAVLARLTTNFLLQPFDPALAPAQMELQEVASCFTFEPVSCSGTRSGLRTDYWENFNSQFLIGSAGLDAFVGTDPLNFYALISAELTGTCSAPGEGHCLVDTNFDWFGITGGVPRALSVIYVYEPNDPDGGDGGSGSGGGSTSVPEPASFALLSIGLLGLAAARRRHLAKPRCTRRALQV